MLVADELVSALDVSVQAQVINLLLELQSRLQLTVVFVAHDLRLVRHISHRVAVMYLGKIVEIGQTEPLFAGPAHPYTGACSRRRPRSTRRGAVRATPSPANFPSPFELPTGCVFRTRCARASDRCAMIRPPLAPTGDGRMVACHHPIA